MKAIKLLNIFLCLSGLSLMLNLSAHAQGNDSGNGGGMVCLANMPCMTLAEAGLRIPGPDEDFYLLPPKILQQVKKTLDLLPLRSYRKPLMDKIAGNGNTYQLLDIASPEKLEVIRQRYAEILKKYDSDIDIHQVRIVAFASKEQFDAITYLLPDFFTLPIEKQAKILIHEAHVKNHPGIISFEEVLELDGLAEDLLQNSSLLTEPKFRIDRWELLLEKATGARSAFSSLANWLMWLRVNKSVVLSWNIACKSSLMNCELDAQKIQTNYEVVPSFVRYILRNSHNLWQSVSTFPSSSHPLIDIKSQCETLLAPENNAEDFLLPYYANSVDTTISKLFCKRNVDGAIDAKIIDFNVQ